MSLSPADELFADLERIGRDGFCVQTTKLISESFSLLTPPEQISTTDCAAQHRYLPSDEGSGKMLWSPELTPYITGIQDALDDIRYRTIGVIKPARVGGTVAGENHLFKRLRHGPLTDTLIYLPGESDVESYADTTFGPFFDLHPEIGAKVGTKTSDNKRKFKRIAGRFIEILPANMNTVRGRKAPYIIADEIDGFKKALRSNFAQQVAFRGRSFGNRRKAYLCSHPDAGWSGGIAPVWAESTRGMWWWECPSCHDWSSPCPKAEWRTVLHYERPEGMADDDMLNHVEASGRLLCPHCGSLLDDDDKKLMLAGGKWVFEGQTIAPNGTVTGEVKPNETAGFWIHGTMSPFVSLGKLAREYVAALVFFEKSRKSERLREVTVKSLGEVFEGAGEGSAGVDPNRLRARAVVDNREEGFARGTVPDDVLFLTAGVDVGGAKFDVIITGWDLDGQAWIVDRYTLKQAQDGRDLRPPERVDDWEILTERLLKTNVPLARDKSLGMPIACIAVDTGGVAGTTWKAREWARRCKTSGASGVKGYRVMLIKGSASARAPEVGVPKDINKDQEGRKVEPAVSEFILGVHKLKEIVVNRLALNVPGPGYTRFAEGLPTSTFDEFAAERMVDGVWERHGANESLDTLAYSEAARINLQPERKGIDWEGRRKPKPSWARPVEIDEAGRPVSESNTATPAGSIAKPAPKSKTVGRLSALNRR